MEQFTDIPNFQEQFARTQALSIGYQGPEGRLSFVLLNTEQTPPEDEPYVIAHEFGHLWLKAGDTQHRRILAGRGVVCRFWQETRCSMF